MLDKLELEVMIVEIVSAELKTSQCLRAAVDSTNGQCSAGEEGVAGFLSK